MNSPPGQSGAGLPYAPTDFYDDDQVFDRYLKGRSLPDDGNWVIEEPVVNAMVGELSGKRVLDLGCGDGRFSAHAQGSGCLSYHGVDGSVRMVARAHELSQWSGATFEQADLETWRGPDSYYDVVLCRMTLHYVRDLGHVFTAIRQSLRRHGVFVFSTEHPLVTSFDNGDFRDRVPDQWTVSNYFRQGDRNCFWLGANVAKQHRTLAEYFSELTAAGLRLAQLSEGEPDASRFADPENYRCRKAIPMYLIGQATMG